MQDSTSQLTASILLGSLSLIPNTALRYTALGLATCLGVLYAVFLKHPSTQLCQLEKMFATTEELIRGAKAQCPRDQLSLAEEWAQFLDPRFTWAQYQLLSKDMTDHITHLTIEAECQRKLTAEIDAEFILCSNMHPLSALPILHTNFTLSAANADPKALLTRWPIILHTSERR
ncbi:hypothetical protein DFH09DRAFT_1075501 [Mycena vulgaris]|nr:hypothetical protein DFH09DRAFT_1075501 [Mycena vulgaris]